MAMRFLGVLSGILLASAGAVFVIALVQAIRQQSPPPFATLPSAVEVFGQSERRSRQIPGASPFVRQAEKLANYLNPPRTTAQEAAPQSRAVQQSRPRFHSLVTPPAPTPRFCVHATSYCPAEPERSMVLISESGGESIPRRWVKEGMQIGHFVIQEIRKGSIVCRGANGERVLEMAVEHESPRNLLAPSQAGLTQANMKASESILDVNLPGS